MCRRRGGEGVVRGVVARRVVERHRSVHGRIRTGKVNVIYGVCVYCRAGSYRDLTEGVTTRDIGVKDQTCTECAETQVATGKNRGENEGANARCGSCGVAFALADATTKQSYGLSSVNQQ